MLRHTTITLSVSGETKEYLAQALRKLIPDIPNEFSICASADQCLQIVWDLEIDPFLNVDPVVEPSSFKHCGLVFHRDAQEDVPEFAPRAPAHPTRIEQGRFLKEADKLYFVPDCVVELVQYNLSVAVITRDNGLHMADHVGDGVAVFSAAECLEVLRKCVGVLLARFDLRSGGDLLLDPFVIARFSLEKCLHEFRAFDELKDLWLAQLEQRFEKPLSDYLVDEKDDTLISVTTSSLIPETVRGCRIYDASGEGGPEYFIPFSALSFAYELVRTGHTRNDGFYFKSSKGGNSSGPYFDARTAVAAIAGQTDSFVRTLGISVEAPLKLDSGMIARVALTRGLTELAVMAQYKNSWLEEIEQWPK